MPSSMVDVGQAVRARRAALGLTQDALADLAQVSRALVGALERGRHMPAADAAIRLARALDTTVERLFGGVAPEPRLAAVPVLGGDLPEGALVRTARVGAVVVAGVVDGVNALTSTGAAPDGVVRDGRLRLFSGGGPAGAVVAGCDPVLGIAEGLLDRSGDARIVAVPATTGQALNALAAGRCHAAVVHGPAASLQAGPGIRRWHLARWRSGIATHTQLSRPSLQALLAADAPLIQRDRTAACQQAVERAARRLGAPRGKPRRTAGGHLDAGRAAVEHRGAAVAIEPVAVVLGLDFHELEVHDVELWVPDAWVSLAGIRALLDLLQTASFRDRAGALPAYDLTDTGAAR